MTNWLATGKFIDLLYGDRFPIKREHLSRWQVAALAQRQPIYVVFLDRSDSRFWIQNAEQNRSWVMALDPPPELELDLQATPTDRLRIWRVSRLLPSG